MAHTDTGLGYEAVRALCRSSQAYQILLGGRSIDKATEAVKKAQAEFPQTASSLETVQVDVEDDASIQDAYKHVSSRYERLDVLINNAGRVSSHHHRPQSL